MAKQRGGARPGSGRKSMYRGNGEKRVFPMKFSAVGRRALDALAYVHTCSRNEIIERLIRADYVPLVETFARGKLYPEALSIRLTAAAGATLDAAAAAVGWSRAALVEYLVLEYGPGLTRLQAGTNVQAPDGRTDGPAVDRAVQGHTARSRAGSGGPRRPRIPARPTNPRKG